jgi:Tfp pilus assembly protein PilX
MLVSILGILAVSALRSATAEARLGASVLAASQAFNLAQNGLVTALVYARARPENLSLINPVVVPVTQPTAPEHSISVTIEASGNDAHCPIFSNGERQHYEIYSTGIAGPGATRTHVRGFYICRELCAGENCVGIENPATPSYWTTIESG